MALHKLMQVDAFTNTPLTGNPCAVVFDAGGLTSEKMLAVAREMNLSETAFLVPSTRADFGVRYFTPAEEIPLAGHPTIATIYALIKSGRLNLGDDGLFHITVEMPAGVIPVEIQVISGIVEQIIMTQKTPVFLAKHEKDVIANIFNLPVEAILDGAPVQTVSTGTPQLMVPLRSLDMLRQVQMDNAAYAQYRANSDFFSPHLFCLEGVTMRGTTFARHFGVPPDTMEDPFTGSATGGMAAFCWRYGLLEKPVFVAEQGHWMHRPGEAQVEVVGTREKIQSVKVGGAAVLIMQGEIEIG